jgi:hypothetical protein
LIHPTTNEVGDKAEAKALSTQQNTAPLDGNTQIDEFNAWFALSIKKLLVNEGV